MINVVWNLISFLQLVFNTFFIPIYVVFRSPDNKQVLDMITYSFDIMYGINIILNLSVRYFEIKENRSVLSHLF